MDRRLVLLAATAAWIFGFAGYAAGQETKEFELPPVKLKPDRPTTAKPIPPTPDERVPPPPAAPAKPAVESPAERPARPIAKPAVPAAPVAIVPAAEPPLLPPPAMPPTPSLETPAEPRVPAEAPSERRPQDIQTEIIEAQVLPAPEMDLTGLGEVGLVEEVARARKAYARALQALNDFYTQRGTAYKLQWVQQEIAAYNKVPKAQYLGMAELAGPDLKPSQRIPAADQLYTEGIHYKEYPAFPPGKKDYLKIAIEKFTTIIEKYPDSDKIDDAAFRMGEIYGGWYFEDWARAVQSYERCWQWDPNTQYPARFNAAKIYDENLKNRVKAVELYNRVVAESNNQDHVNKALERIKALTGK